MYTVLEHFFQGDERGAERDLVIDNQRFMQLLVAEGILVFCASGVKRVARLSGLEFQEREVAAAERKRCSAAGIDDPVDPLPGY